MSKVGKFTEMQSGHADVTGRMEMLQSIGLPWMGVGNENVLKGESMMNVQL